MIITIIGAGIGGLTTAIALKQKGFDIELFEAAPEFKRAGSGINLAINAMQVYRQLGVYDTILEAGSLTDTIAITDTELNPLSIVDLNNFEEKFNVKSVAIHRATLHQILLNELNDVPLHLGKKVKKVVEEEGKVNLTFEDGNTHTAEVLLGADGIHSVIRKSIFNNTKLRNAKQVCWRGITNIKLPSKYQTQLNEPWGKGKRFGFVAIGKDQYYWYALSNYKTNYKEEFEHVNLGDFYSDFHPVVAKIINATPSSDVLTNEMLDLKPIATWYKKNICLVGDSAHATTPNLGQGACQAIESALVLANCLARYQLPEHAFKAFQDIRYKKAVYVVNTSWSVGKMAHLENSLLIGIRNFVVRHMPKNMAIKQSERIFEIDKEK
jgi:2-polyprenyl-6-methoxyphenol hydroxylase-like FAD-dependent oxidoreductase